MISCSKQLRMPCWLLCLSLGLLSAAAMAEESPPASEASPNIQQQTSSNTQTINNSTESPKANKVQVKVEQSEEAPDPPSWKNKKIAPETTPMERFVWPFTRWLEEKVHNTSLIRSPDAKLQDEQAEPQGLNLREAIQQASDRYPGTVLSADKLEQDGKLEYRVKIISPQGVVKTLSVTGKPTAREESP